MSRIILEGGHIFDPLTGERTPNTCLIIEGTGIEAICSQGDSPCIDSQDTIIKLTPDHTILPGLIDSHVHVQGSGQPHFEEDFKDPVALKGIRAGENAVKTLMAGFTTIRDASAESLIDLSVKRAIEKGIIKGPRMLVSCRGLSNTGGHGDHANGWPPEIQFAQRYVVDGPMEVRKAVREQFRDGADVIKVAATGGILSTGDNPDHLGLRLDEMKEAVEEAKSAGKKVMAHAQGSAGIKNAILAGVHSIEHGSILTEEILDMMLERNVFLVPTLIAGYLIHERGTDAGIPAASVAKAGAIVEKGFQSFRKAHEAGVQIAMGTDAGTCFNYHGQNARELELMVEHGMSESQALQSATIKGAELLDLAGEIGTLEKGKRADLIVVQGNPLASIKILQDQNAISLIMKDGEIIKNLF